MRRLEHKTREFATLFRSRSIVSPRGICFDVAGIPRCSPSSVGRHEEAPKTFRLVQQSNLLNSSITRMVFMDTSRGFGWAMLSREQFRRSIPGANFSDLFHRVYSKHHLAPPLVRTLSSGRQQSPSDGTTEQEARKDLSTTEDPFEDLTYNIPQKPVTFVEGASYSIVILAGLGIAALAAYAVFKELIFQPKEYKIFGKALERIRMDSQVTVRIGSPVTGYGQESKNRAARQRIPNRVWTDEDGVEHVEVNFYIRGPHGGGKVYAEMFKDQTDKKWKFTYLIVEILSPTKAQLMLESYVPE